MRREYDDFYEQLMALHREEMDSGFYETAYHILAAASHRARVLDSGILLALVEKQAQEAMKFIDQHYQTDDLSLQSARAHATYPLYETLAKQAAMRRQTLIIDKDLANRRNPNPSYPKGREGDTTEPK